MTNLIPEVKVNYGGLAPPPKPKPKIHPMTKLQKYITRHNLKLIDFFQKFDADGSMSVSHEEFRIGLEVMIETCEHYISWWNMQTTTVSLSGLLVRLNWFDSSFLGAGIKGPGRAVTYFMSLGRVFLEMSPIHQKDRSNKLYTILSVLLSDILCLYSSLLFSWLWG